MTSVSRSLAVYLKKSINLVLIYFHYNVSNSRLQEKRTSTKTYRIWDILSEYVGFYIRY